MQTPHLFVIEHTMHNLWNKHVVTMTSAPVWNTQSTQRQGLWEVHSPGDSREVQDAPLGQLAETAPYSALEPNPMHLKGADLGPCYSMVQDKVQPNSRVHT